MNRIIISIAIVMLVAASAAMMNEEKKKLVWSDEFEQGIQPDQSKWTMTTGNGCPANCGFGNNELQYYTDDKKNIKIEDGKLVINAHKRSVDECNYTSAKLVSAHKGDWTYGRIEVRAKLPQGRGTWPAIWMLPTLERDLQWPADGEIDIMEHVGYNQGWVYGTIHTEKYNHMLGTHKTDSIYVEDVHQEFHTYAIEWDKNSLTWFVDDQQYNYLERGDDDHHGWPFDGDFHLILNLAVGGDWGGKYGVDDSIWPQELIVDYVRVYKM